MEVVKTRLALAPPGFYKGIVNAALTIAKTEVWSQNVCRPSPVDEHLYIYKLSSARMLFVCSVLL